MVKFTKEYLSLIQCLLYRAQKRKKTKQVIKFKKIFYKSKSIILFILRYQSRNHLKQKKIKKCLSESMFKNFLKFSILKKQIQNYYFLNPQFKSKNQIPNFSEIFNNVNYYTLLLNSKKKQLFFSNFIFNSNNIKLSFLYLRHLKIEFFCLFTYSVFLLFLPTSNYFTFNVKKTNLGTKESKYLLGKFNYQTYYNFYVYHHNYFLDSVKIQYQQNVYLDLLSNRKQQFFINKRQKKNINIKINTQFIQKTIDNYKNYRFQKNNLHFYSIISDYSFFRNNRCFFYSKVLDNLFFYYLKKIKLLKLKLNNIQKQILLIMLEPIWESLFEISSYSNRPGRSLYDAIEYIRLNLRKQPMFLFKIYLKFFDKISYKSQNIKRNFNKFDNFFLYNKYFLFNNINIIFSFFCFFQNITFYGIQQKYQNNYLRTKEQLFLYQIIKIIKENNKKNDIYFYKFFYNKYFYILMMQNKLQKIFINRNTINTNNICSYLKKNKYKKIIKNYKKFIIDYNKNNKKIFNQYKHNLLSKNYLTNNFLIFLLNNFFFEKIKNLKQRLFLIELYKQKFPFYLEKFIVIFFPVTNSFSKIKGTSFSTILKDSNLFVAKSAFLLFFIKNNKKALFATNLLNYWNNDNFCFFKIINTDKNFQLKIDSININKWELIFVLPTQKKSQLNYKILLKINLSFVFGYFNSLNYFLNIPSFHNSFLRYLFFIKIKKIDFYSNLLIKKILINNKIFFMIMHYCNFDGKFFSFFELKLKMNFIIFLLKKNDVRFIWNTFIKYENQILSFNSNFLFLKSFQTILKKWMILNKILYFLYFEDKKELYISSFSNIRFQLKSFFNYCQDWIFFYLKDLLNRNISKYFYLINLSNKKLYLKRNIKREKTNKNFNMLSILCSIKFFVIKEKHTYLLYNKKFNGFSFFNFFMFHKNQTHQQFFLNVLFFWQFYFTQVLKKFKYINCFNNYYDIYFFIIKKNKIWIKKKIKQRVKFHFLQFFFLKYDYQIMIRNKNSLKYFNFIIFSLKNISSFRLFNIIFSNILKTKDESILIYYQKLLQQQQLKISYYFSIKPSKSNIKKHLYEIHHLVKNSHNKTQKYIIFKVSKIIKNWCLYYQIITPTILYKYLDYLTLQILWRWACKRHYQKSKKWIKMKYFYKIKINGDKLSNISNLNKTSNQSIVFASKINFFMNFNRKKYKYSVFKHFFNQYINHRILNNNQTFKRIFICLPNHNDIILIKHNFIQNDRSPFDGDFFYWIPRNFYS
nr:group II intron maturase-specific domain protein [Oedogonium crispum]